MAVNAQTCTIGALQIDLRAEGGERPRPGCGEFHEVHGCGGVFVDGAVCWATQCYFNACPLNRNRLATRDLGNTAASATA